MSDDLRAQVFDHALDRSVVGLGECLEASARFDRFAVDRVGFVNRFLVHVVDRAHEIVESVPLAKGLHAVDVGRGRNDLRLEAAEHGETVAELALQAA